MTTDLYCPYCQGIIDSSETSCATCQKTFPWVPELEKLRNDIKSRESNRLRATFTLIDEAMQAVRGKGTISISALKGFIASWIFPRSMIVIGSLIGGIFLGLQTYIIWSQTKLLANQADAAQLDRALKVRDRIVETTGHSTKLANLMKEIKLARMRPSFCSNDSCKNVSVENLIAKLKDEKVIQQLPQDQVLTLTTKINQLNRITKVALDASGLNTDLSWHEERFKNLIFFSIVKAGVDCQFSGGDYTSVKQQLESLTKLGVIEPWWVVENNDGNYWIAFKTGYSSSEIEKSAALFLERLFPPEDLVISAFDKKFKFFSLSEFEEVWNHILNQTYANIHDIQAECSRRKTHDMELLRKLDTYIN